MENITQLVDSSLVRHGVAANFDHLRLQWSSWFRCESSFSVLLAPAKPGIFALGEEIVPASETMGALASSPGAPVDDQSRLAGRRMLALFQVSEADDLGMALGRLFLPGTPLRDRLTSSKCFARYAVIEDPAQRRIAAEVFQRWMQDSAETATGIDTCGADTPVRAADVPLHTASIGHGSEAGIRNSRKIIEINKTSTSFAWGMEVQEREVEELKRPQPLPSGF
jgi:hypothetical protein